MKIIKILQENGETVELTDNDDTNITEYTTQLKELFKSNDIIILETSSGSIIIRPHKINSILVIDNSELSDEDNTSEVTQTSEDFIRG